MGCACRVTPLRIFIQGLSQVHKIETPSSFLRLRAPPTSAALYRNQLLVARPLHGSRHLNQEQGASVVPSPPAGTEPEGTQASTDESSSANENRSEAVEPVAVAERAIAVDPSTTTDPATTPAPTATITDDKPWKNRGDGPGGSRLPREFKSNSASSEPIVGPSPSDPAPDVPTWKTQKAALKEKFPDGWQPRKRLSPDALAGIRALNAQFPDTYTTSTLASRFEVSPENIRRILKSSWQPSTDEEKDRQDRWFRRGMKVWDHQAALGMKPPRKWRLEGINRDPSYHVKRQGAIRRNRQLEEQDDREVRAKLGRPATRKTPRK
ncbi:hypothetical protein EDB80DRAFT_650904 [Ilyonectria destructans]|nr:hypothetical protein EDB80DRAFT_650904 [Ilyonectria destructans]